MMDKTLARCIRWVALMYVLAACAAPPDPTWERLQETGVLRVGMDASYPPFESIAKDGTLVGLDVDIAREISNQLGLEPEFLPNLPYDGLYDALRAERVDIVISALPIDPSRREDYAYSEPYFYAGHVLVARLQWDSVQSVADLAGHSVGVVLGTEGDREARRWARRLRDLNLLQYNTVEEALKALQESEADVVVIDRVSALRATGSDTDLTIVGEPLTMVPYACAMRRDSVRLLDAVNQALKGMEDDSTMELLISTWLR